MSGHGHYIDLGPADQLGLGLLAQGGDLFDLSQLADNRSEPAIFAAAISSQDHGLSDLLVQDFEPETAHAVGGHTPYLQLAGLDTSALVFPSPQHQADVAPATHPDATAQASAGHGPALTLDDILAAAADDLASFHTAAGGSAGHAPMGSGFFTPFNPAGALSGLTEMHIISAG